LLLAELNSLRLLLSSEPARVLVSEVIDRNSDGHGVTLLELSGKPGDPQIVQDPDGLKCFFPELCNCWCPSHPL